MNEVEKQKVIDSEKSKLESLVLSGGIDYKIEYKPFDSKELELKSLVEQEREVKRIINFKKRLK
jgi:hypothetical protein